MKTTETVRVHESERETQSSGAFSDVGFNAVFESSDEALLLIDAAGIVRRVNRRARELLPAQTEELADSRLANYLSRPSVEEFEALCQRVLSSHALVNADG